MHLSYCRPLPILVADVHVHIVQYGLGQRIHILYYRDSHAIMVMILDDTYPIRTNL